MTATKTEATTQVYRVYIKATPEAIWDALTKSEFTDRYGYGGLAEYDLRPSGAFRLVSSQSMRDAAAAAGIEIPEVAVDGEVIEAGAPRRLAQTWRLIMSPEPDARTRLDYDISEQQGGVTKLTVTHDLDGAPQLAHLVAGNMEETGAGGGWSWVLSGLKTLLETGQPLAS